MKAINLKKFFSSKIKVSILISIILFLFWYSFFALPEKLFNVPYATVIQSNNHELLSLAIASDEQWRFPAEDSIPYKFKEALITFEDKRFWNHRGVDLRALLRATNQNIKAGKVVSGGSTITMQVIRIANQENNRSILNKLYEIILATRLEFRFSKDEILNLYSTHAPFGGNIVGLSAACARYFGNSSADLSWAEAAMLAVLPNDPALIHPGKNRNRLLEKRNRLLIRLRDLNKIDSLTCSLAMEEPLPDEPLPFPTKAPHLLTQSIIDGHSQKKIKTTINNQVQTQVTAILTNHASRLFANHVYNAGVLVAEVNSGNVLAYVGNLKSSSQNQDQVNIITAPRSTGSILKPFLFAALLEEGKILPGTLIPDVPLDLAGFAPENFTRQFDGAVSANIALIRSLNIPAVHELREYRYEKFHTLLKGLGMSSLNHSPSQYGLTLILGGAEGTLWDITSMYASMGRVLNQYFERAGSNRYSSNDIRPLHYIDTNINERELETHSLLSAGTIWATMETLKEVYRPGEESGWKIFNSSKTIAWKTGTSLGHRDAWAVGLNGDYVVGVWVGNADGEGRPGLTGTEAAAPIMLDVFNFLPGRNWFNKPTSELSEIIVCNQSGMRISSNCLKGDTVLVPNAGLNTLGCTYHKVVALSKDQKFRVNTNCESIDNIALTNWFVLPPVQEYYYRLRNTSYKTLPPIRSDCDDSRNITAMEIIYPKSGSKIYLPTELDGSSGKLIIEATHRSKNSTIYWHLDQDYIGATSNIHQITMSLKAGQHKLTLIDNAGEIYDRQFTILTRN